MKKFAYIILSIVVVSVLASSSALAQAKKAEVAATKITQQDAQQAVMAKYPSAHVIRCELGTVNGNSAWTVMFTRTGGNIAEKVAVDAQTGKVTKL